MLLTYLLATTLPSALSAPISDLAPDPYNCGYVLTEHNSSAYAGIYAYSTCEPIYYNETIRDFQDAYAYRMYGGCGCQFYDLEQECTNDTDAPTFTGPTSGSRAVDFEDPKPKWYICWTQA